MQYDERTALVVVDVQNDFADPAGSLYVRGGEDVVAVVAAEMREAQRAGALVVRTQDWHPPETPHFTTRGGVWPVHCVRDTWGAEFSPGLPDVGPVLRKGTGGEDGYSGFTVRDPLSGEESGTALADLLREHATQRVVVAGLAGDVCVKATALDAAALGFQVTLPLEATRMVELQPGDGERAVAELLAAGVHVVPATGGTGVSGG